MNRIDLINKLLNAKRKATDSHNEFLSVPKEYYPKEKLYMREAHLAILLEEPNTISGLAKKTNVTLGAISQLVKQMEKKGFVKREKPLDDRRKTLVLLTDKGIELCKNHKEFDNEIFSRISVFLEKFTNEDINKFIEYEYLMSEIFSHHDEVGI